MFRTINLYAAFFGILWSVASQAKDRGYEIAKESRESGRGYEAETADIDMVIENRKGQKKRRQLEYKGREQSRDDSQVLFVFTGPADIRDTKLLTWSHADRTDEQWLYLPGIRKTKRITSRNKTGAFLGSTFTYEDLIPPEIEKYEYKFQKKAKVGGRPVDVVERRPKDRDSGYSRQVVFFDRDHKQPLQIDYYDRKNKLLKTAVFSEYRKFKGFWRFAEVEMKNHQKGDRTVMTWSKRKLKAQLSSRDFDRNRLGR